MALVQSVKIEGLRELERALIAIPRQLRVKTVYRALHDAARIVRDDARRRAPEHIPSGLVALFNKSKEAEKVRGNGGKRGRRSRIKNAEGLLRSRIVEHSVGRANYGLGFVQTHGRDTVVVRVSNKGYHRLNGKIRFNAPGSSPGWWWWLEFGTSRMAARPFLRPAFEANKFRAAQEIKASLKRGIEAIALDVASRSRLGRASFRAQAALGL